MVKIYLFTKKKSTQIFDSTVWGGVDASAGWWQEDIETTGR